MKKYIILLLIAGLVASLDSFAQDGKANLTFKTTKFDFGTIKEEGGIVSAFFEFANSGKGPLVLQLC